MDITKTKTERGFRYDEFNDNYGQKCSLQKSSSALEDKIWLGINDAKPEIKVFDAKAMGRADICDGETVGWVPWPVPPEVLMHTRMHLTREQVAALLPALQHFVETGELPPLPEEPTTATEKYVIHKNCRSPDKVSYDGASWDDVDAERKDTYEDRAEAEAAAKLLSEVNPVGFSVSPARKA